MSEISTVGDAAEWIDRVRLFQGHIRPETVDVIHQWEMVRGSASEYLGTLFPADSPSSVAGEVQKRLQLAVGPPWAEFVPSEVAGLRQIRANASSLLNAIEWTRRRARLTVDQVVGLDLLYRDVTGLIDDLEGRIVEVISADAKQEANAAVAQLAAARAEIDETRAEIEETRSELARVKGASADAELATHFSTLAGNESKIAATFRWTALVALVVATLVGVAGVARGWDGDALKVGDALLHVIVAVGLASISAYCARLGSRHQITADWARSIEVQLKTFELFLVAIDDSVLRNRIYEEFSRRVLGSPPSSAGETTEAGLVPLSQVVELAGRLRGLGGSAS